MKSSNQGVSEALSVSKVLTEREGPILPLKCFNAESMSLKHSFKGYSFIGLCTVFHCRHSKETPRTSNVLFIIDQSVRFTSILSYGKYSMELFLFDVVIPILVHQ